MCLWVSSEQESKVVPWDIGVLCKPKGQGACTGWLAGWHFPIVALCFRGCLPAQPSSSPQALAPSMATRMTLGQTCTPGCSLCPQPSHNTLSKAPLPETQGLILHPIRTLHCPPVTSTHRHKVCSVTAWSACLVCKGRFCLGTRRR